MACSGHFVICFITTLNGKKTAEKNFSFNYLFLSKRGFVGLQTKYAYRIHDLSLKTRTLTTTNYATKTVYCVKMPHISTDT